MVSPMFLCLLLCQCLSLCLCFSSLPSPKIERREGLCRPPVYGYDYDHDGDTHHTLLLHSCVGQVPSTLRMLSLVFAVWNVDGWSGLTGLNRGKGQRLSLFPLSPFIFCLSYPPFHLSARRCVNGPRLWCFVHVYFFPRLTVLFSFCPRPPFL
jgi:hypothetical protein